MSSTKEVKDYVIWAEGGVTFMGIRDWKGCPTDDDEMYVRDPMSIVFSTKQVPVIDEKTNEPTGETRGKLFMDCFPWLYSVAISKGENVWSINPKTVLSGAIELNAELIRAYEMERIRTGSAPSV